MFKELKYFSYTLIISFFIFFTIKYYFSDENIKNSNRFINNYKSKLEFNSLKLLVLESDTNNIIEYPEKKDEQNKKRFNFWSLLSND
tara:strand:- start:7 stop:267 length:261 start_codon:yes stop_codon:yes gene_type:complete